jgi:hypothetical protein
MIAFSYHKDCIGPKPEKRLVPGDTRETLWIGNKKINLGYGWQTAELPFEDIYELLSVHGYAFAPALSCDHRERPNFVSHEIALVDIDGNMTLEELHQHPFYCAYGSGYYTTSSHTEEHHKFRILYRLPCAITDADTMETIYEGLIALHQAKADKACKDAVRLFYGSLNAAKREMTDRMIDAEALQLIVLAADSVRPPVKEVRLIDDSREYEPKTAEQVEELLDELCKYYPVLRYETRRDVTWAVMSAVDPATAIALLRSRWSDSNSTGKYEMFANDRKTNKLSLGTIYHMIRLYDPLYGRGARQLTTDEIKQALQKAKEQQ